MIKLYVLIAIVEVFDRLMCSLGQDCLDSMYWNTTRRPRSSRMLISVSVVVVYTAMHSLILLLHVATLNVAMNSADEALCKCPIAPLVMFARIFRQETTSHTSSALNHHSAL